MSNNLEQQNEYLNLFKGRTDKVGQPTETNPISIAVKPEDISRRITEHLNGTRRLGFYNLLPNATSPWAVIEFEDHGHCKLDNPNQSSLDFLEHLATCGITGYRERSKNTSGNCYHVWIFFNKPISSKKLHIALNAFMQDAMGIKTEVFPKGYDPKSIGNFVWLPLFGGTDNYGLGVNEKHTVFIDENGLPYPIQIGFLKDIQTVTEEMFDAFVDVYKLPTDEQFKGLKKAAGESTSPFNDLAKIRECSFMRFCEDNAGDLAEPIWYAWITNAVTCVGGREYIHEYSSKHTTYSKTETEKKIAHALRDSGPMLHETISGLGYTCDCPTKFKAPVSRSNYIDIEAEVKRIKAIAETEARAMEVKKLISYWNRLDAVEKDMYQEIIKKAFKLTNRAFKLDEDTNGNGTIDYTQSAADVLHSLGNVDDVERAKILFAWFKENGAQYFTDETDNHYIYWVKKLTLMQDHSSDFESLLLATANVSTATPLGHVVVQVMNASAHTVGRRIKKNTWLQSDRKNLAVYMNLKNSRNELLKIDSKELRIIPNGDNTDDTFMLDTANNKIEPIEFQTMNDEQLRCSLQLAENLVVRHTPATLHDQWISYGWVMSYPLYDFTNDHFLLRYQGKHEMGKSTASRLHSYWIYGKDCLNIQAYVASSYSDASQNPLVLDDNMEAKTFFSDPDRMSFYLGAGTGGSKQKRDTKTASGNIIETIRALVLCNGIESIAKSELTSRMMIIDCDRELYNSNYTSAVLLEIEQHRDELVSANFILTQRVLKRIQSGDWNTVQQKLKAEYSKNPKNRMFEHLSIIILYLEEFFKAAGKPESVWNMIRPWLDSQGTIATNEIIGGDPIVQAVDLLKDSAMKQDAIQKEIDITDNTTDKIALQKQIKLDVKSLFQNVTVTGTEVSMTGFARDLLSAFSNAYKVYYNQSFPINNSRVVGSRLEGVRKELKAHGYEVTDELDKHEKQNKYTIIYKQAA